MAITRYNPYTTTSALDRLERFFDIEGRPFDSFDTDDVFVPAVESFSNNEALHLRAEVPGIDPKDIHIEVTDGHLCITGERKVPEYAKEACCCFEEMTYGSFERCFTIPSNIERDKIKAKNEFGILDITIPLPESVRPHVIRVE
jgi:HSP20 family protein